MPGIVRDSQASEVVPLGLFQHSPAPCAYTQVYIYRHTSTPSTYTQLYIYTQRTRAVVMAPSTPEPKECLDMALRHIWDCWGFPMQEPGIAVYDPGESLPAQDTL